MSQTFFSKVPTSPTKATSQGTTAMQHAQLLPKKLHSVRLPATSHFQNPVRPPSTELLYSMNVQGLSIQHVHGQSNKYVHQAAAVHTKEREGSDMSAHITAVLTACCNSMQPEAESSCSTQHGLPSPDPRADMGTVPSHKHTQCGPMQLHQLHAQEMYNIHTLQERYKATDVQGNRCTVQQHEDDVL